MINLLIILIGSMIGSMAGVMLATYIYLHYDKVKGDD